MKTEVQDSKGQVSEHYKKKQFFVSVVGYGPRG
jgi:hypothetical protein